MNCSKCDLELEPVIPERNRRKEDSQYRDALVVDLRGGYGMFIDYLEEGNPRFIICKNCAEQLFKENPWLITPDSAHLETYFQLKEGGK